MSEEKKEKKVQDRVTINLNVDVTFDAFQNDCPDSISQPQDFLEFMTSTLVGGIQGNCLSKDRNVSVKLVESSLQKTFKCKELP
jgi:hypothetical protein